MAVKLHTVMAMVMLMMSSVMARHVERIIFMEMQVEETEKVQTVTALPNLPDLVDQLGLSDLYSAVVAASLGDALSAKGPFTLFAPTNQAFKDAKDIVDKLVKNVTALREVLEYHVLAGEVRSSDIKDELSVKTLMGKPIRFNIYPNNKVYTAQCAPIDLDNVNKNASNGVLHELKAIMFPPVGSIVDAARGLGTFKTLVKALQVAGLEDTLAGPGPFTVFAPTDAAFAKLDPETLDKLLKNKTALTNVLLYHVTKLTYCRAGLVSYTKIQMLNTQDIAVSMAGGELKVNNIPVLPVGVGGSVTNGVIHKIEEVLMPPSLRLHP